MWAKRKNVTIRLATDWTISAGGIWGDYYQGELACKWVRGHMGKYIIPKAVI
jgi:hypothetical protein